MNKWSPFTLGICLVCDAVWCLTILAACAYIVFWRGESGWWFVLALFICTCWSCKPYRSPQQIEADKEDND
jgi:hypothetical protein